MERTLSIEDSVPAETSLFFQLELEAFVRAVKATRPLGWAAVQKLRQACRSEREHVRSPAREDEALGDLPAVPEVDDAQRPGLPLRSIDAVATPRQFVAAAGRVSKLPSFRTSTPPSGHCA